MRGMRARYCELGHAGLAHLYDEPARRGKLRAEGLAWEGPCMVNFDAVGRAKSVGGRSCERGGGLPAAARQSSKASPNHVTAWRATPRCYRHRLKHTLARLYSAHEEGMFSARAGTRAGLSCYILHGVLVSPQCRLLKTRIRTR